MSVWRKPCQVSEVRQPSGDSLSDHSPLFSSHLLPSMYTYELPTTGAVSFSNFCVDQSRDRAYTHHIPEATQARANLRGLLKDSKRTEGEKDYLALVKVRHISCLNCPTIPTSLFRSLTSIFHICKGSLLVSPMTRSARRTSQVRTSQQSSFAAWTDDRSAFSWRTTLTANLFNTSPRLDFTGLYADYSFSLLTYGFALSNLAQTVVISLGTYELDRAISDVDRRSKDDKLNVAIDFLCRASGIFTHVSKKVLPDWETSRSSPPGFHRPPDLTNEVTSALAK